LARLEWRRQVSASHAEYAAVEAQVKETSFLPAIREPGFATENVLSCDFALWVSAFIFCKL